MSVVLAAGISACAASSTSPATLNLGVVGPPLSVPLAPTHEGTLVVYTDWIPVPMIDADTHQRADYRILRTDGTVFRKISNAGSAKPVALPEGAYLVATAVQPYGAIRIPVRVTADQQTQICLTGEWDSSFQRVPADAVVKLPDGRVIGWRSQPLPGVVNPTPAP